MLPCRPLVLGIRSIANNTTQGLKFAQGALSPGAFTLQAHLRSGGNSIERMSAAAWEELSREVRLS